MPKFNKSVEELTTRFEKWLFVIKNLNKLERIPKELQEKIFVQLFESAEIAKFSPKEYQDYFPAFFPTFGSAFYFCGIK